eukprot:948712-Amphidinium_carterae.1
MGIVGATRSASHSCPPLTWYTLTVRICQRSINSSKCTQTLLPRTNVHQEQLHQCVLDKGTL